MATYICSFAQSRPSEHIIVIDITPLGEASGVATPRTITYLDASVSRRGEGVYIVAADGQSIYARRSGTVFYWTPIINTLRGMLPGRVVLSLAYTLYIVYSVYCLRLYMVRATKHAVCVLCW